jgi:predicted nucleic acid-binding protein
VTRNIVLDAGPLSLLASPRKKAASVECWDWLEGHIAAGASIFVPEIADCEVRRELIRAEKTKSIRALDEMTNVATFVPISTTSMRLAADFWARLRRAGLPTAGDNSIDADCILAAQVAALPDFIVATTNVRHIVRLVPAAEWESILPADDAI